MIIFVDMDEGDTGAQFQERCTRIALQDHWANKIILSDEVEITIREQPVKICPHTGELLVD